jgi:hypothetical protein
MRSIVFQNSAASAVTIAWIVDSDCTIEAFNSPTNSWLLSDNPSATQAVDVIAPTATKAAEQLFIPSGSFTVGLNLPLFKGQKIYAASSASKGSAILMLEDPIKF